MWHTDGHRDIRALKETSRGRSKSELTMSTNGAHFKINEMMNLFVKSNEHIIATTFYRLKHNSTASKPPTHKAQSSFHKMQTHVNETEEF